MIAQTLHADDPGITKVRLIQLSDSIYTLEADFPQSLLFAIKTPILPKRFEFIDFELYDESGWITLNGKIKSSGSPFNSNDEIILPWDRNGIDFTAQWTGGAIYKKLFRKSLGGIHIPLKELMSTQKSTLTIVKENILLGLEHVSHLGVHILMIILIILLYPSFQSIKKLIWYSVGQTLGMIISELYLLKIELFFAEILIVLLIFLLSYTLAYRKDFHYLGLSLLIIGFVHSSSFAFEIKDPDLLPIQTVQAVFAFNMVLDIIHFSCALLFVFIIRKLDIKWGNTRFIWIASGSLSFFLILMIFQDAFVRTNKGIMADSEKVSFTIGNIESRSKINNPQTLQSSGKMTTPVMTFLSVESFEVRMEVLVKAGLLFSGNGTYSNMLIEDPDKLKMALGNLILEQFELKINDQLRPSEETKVDFVNMTKGGITIRSVPGEEDIENAIIGVSCIYGSKLMPDSIEAEWRFFPDSVTMVEASAVDPHGTFTTILKPDNNKLVWKSPIINYSVPVLESIKVKAIKYPLVSIIVWLVIIIYMIHYVLKKKNHRGLYWLVIMFYIGIMLYPFVRQDVSASFSPRFTPSPERTQVIIKELLNNVYRAFDRKEEALVYDCLALSVTGDQLTEVYLQNRKAMELENRGGARVKVNEVQVREIFSVIRGESGKYLADALWTVSGSVNHFGHTHYRQNKHRAMISFLQQEDIWKIVEIESFDVERVY